MSDETKNAKPTDNAADAAAKRQTPVRIPVGSQSRLRFPGRPGYARRVVNDIMDGERVRIFLDAGWRIVEGNVPGGDARTGVASQVGSLVARSVGGGVKGILMEIPRELYDRDQKAKHERVDGTEEELRRQRVDHESKGDKVLIER